MIAVPHTPVPVQTVAPAAEPVSTAEAKAHLRVDHTDDDSYIDALVQAARLDLETATRRAFVTRTYRLQMDAFPAAAAALELPRPPLASVVSIAYIDGNGDSQTWAGANYHVDTDSEPGRVKPVPGSLWPIAQDDRMGAVTITFTAGYGGAAAVPQGLKQAVLLLVAHWYENREAVMVGHRVESLPMAVQRLVWAHRWGGYP